MGCLGRSEVDVWRGVITVSTAGRPVPEGGGGGLKGRGLGGEKKGQSERGLEGAEGTGRKFGAHCVEKKGQRKRKGAGRSVQGLR